MIVHGLQAGIYGGVPALSIEQRHHALSCYAPCTMHHARARARSIRLPATMAAADAASAAAAAGPPHAAKLNGRLEFQKNL
jgi:hypothetical protein